MGTQQLQCTTVSQHSMCSYIVEPGRQCCDQHSAPLLGLGRELRKALAVLQNCTLTKSFCHGATRSLCLHAMEWNEQLRAQHRNNNCQDRLVPCSAPHLSRRGHYTVYYYQNYTMIKIRNKQWTSGTIGFYIHIRLPVFKQLIPSIQNYSNLLTLSLLSHAHPLT